MPAWAWWGVISIGLLALGRLDGRLSRQQAPAGHGPWDTSWAVSVSPNGGATDAILEGIKGAKHSILVQEHQKTF